MVAPLVVAGRVALRAAKKYRKYRKAKRALASAKRGRGAAKAADQRPYLTSPEGLIILTVALIFDFIPSPFNIPGTIAVNIWLYFRGGYSRSGGLGKFAKKRGLGIALELIPIVNIFWLGLTIPVYKTLRKT